MSKKKKQNKKQSYSTRQLVIQIYLLLMFGLFPVFCTDGFFNIRHDRYYFFLALSLAVLAILGLLWFLEMPERKKLPYAVRTAEAVSAGAWYQRLSLSDWGMLGFLVCCAVSTVLSPHFPDALWGTAGRNNGLVLMVVYVAVYFAVSRCGEYRPFLFIALAAVSAFVSLVAVLNFFHLDPLGMLEPLSENDKLRFFSTIGNKNLLSAYLCITVPALVTWFVHTRDSRTGWLYLTASALGFAAMMAADSDSGFLGMGVFTAVCLIWYAREPEKLRKLLLALTLMLLSAKLLAIIPGENKGMGTLQSFLVYSPGSLCLLAVLAAQTVLMYFIHRKAPDRKLPPSLRWVLVGVLGCGLLACVALTVYFTVIDPEVPIEAPWTLLRIDDRWGTNRGFMWRRSADIFAQASLLEKLFGTGPDTFYYAFRPYFGELSKLGDGSTNAAHNEYINYLITVGVLGLVCYLVAVIGAVVKGFKGAKEDPVRTAACAAVISCAAQALVNIAQPITMPLFILFLALCAGNRKPVTAPGKRKK